MRPTAGAARTASRSAAGSDGSASPSSAEADPGTPASRAIAPTVAGASPERTLSVDLLLDEERDRLGRVRPQPFGEHDEAERAHIARERRLGAVVGSGASARPSGEHAAPASSPRRGARSASSGSAAAKRSGAPEHEALVTQVERAPAPPGRERHLCDDATARSTVGEPGIRDRLQRQVARGALAA